MSFKKLVIAGPTAVGKSDLAIEIAGDKFEIVSADSVQVYRYLDIGSCKPCAADLEKVRHHCIDLVDPDYQFSAGDFCHCAFDACEEIYTKKLIPMFVGGSGLYINSFFYGISTIPDIDSDVKKSLIEEMEHRGSEVLYSELKGVDPVFAEKIHINDKQRIIRGLEVYRATGRSISSYYAEKVNYLIDDLLFIGIYREKDELIRRISSRVDSMISGGLVDEVISLRKRGYSPLLNSMRSIGYLEINEYLDNMTDLQTGIEKIKVNTKKYAKKQMTWFKKNRGIIWFHSSEIKKIKNKINNWLNII